ncbi:MAG: hypothetical protein U0S76_00600 [Pseudoxanthomonas sp.]|nr:hypothetical protein [Pseudoxanthomonas sp.]
MRMRFMLMLCLFPLVAAAEPLDVDGGCLDCHRPTRVRLQAPIIEGQSPGYLVNQLRRFRERHRDSFPMSALVAGMSEADLQALAAELASRPWPAWRMRVDEAAVERGGIRVRQFACDACHGASFLGEGDLPRLAGQHPGYLRRQLDAFGERHRHHPPSATGAPLTRLGVRDRGDIAAFLHAAGAAGSGE